jgi:glutamine amidotransferase
MALRKVGASVELVDTAWSWHQNFSHFVLPGVGAFPSAMEKLRERQLAQPLKELSTQGIPLLGICLGMQLLFEDSSELGGSHGLGIIEGQVESLDSFPTANSESEPVTPNIGWRAVKFLNDEGNRKTLDNFYFVHSYGVRGDHTHATAVTDFFGAKLASEVRFESTLGCQFHPEKSGDAGLAYLDNFLSKP